MSQSVYVNFEPGVNAEQSLPATPLFARRVDRVPEVDAVRTDQADAWFERPTLDNLLDLQNRQPADVVTRVAILCDDRHLFVAFDCAEPDFRGVRRFVTADAPNGGLRVFAKSIVRTLDHDDHVAVGIDPAHDHTRVHWLATNLNGARRATTASYTMSWAAAPVVPDHIDAPALRWDSAVVEQPGRWRAAMRIDLASLGIDPVNQPTVGIHLGRARYGACLRHFASTAALPGELVAPLAMADLYFRGGKPAVLGINWRSREYGPHSLDIDLLGGAEPCQARVIATIAHASGTQLRSESPAVRLAAGARAPVTLACSMPHNFETATLAVTVEDTTTGRPLYRASFPLGNHADLNVLNPRPQGAAEPRLGDADFHARKRDFVLSRLPRFVRRTTAQGAASDFVLQSEDGRVVFNLMESGAMGQIGRWLDSLFDNAIDRLVAAAVFSNDNWVTTHCAARVGMHAHLTPLSCLRLGAGHCYSRAMAGAGIVAAMTDPRTGRPFEAYPVLVLGHVVVAVRWRDAWTFLDPSFGHFFFNASNTDLATDAELEADPQLIRRVGLGEHRLYNYGRRDVHVRLEEGAIVWPAGAPPK